MSPQSMAQSMALSMSPRVVDTIASLAGDSLSLHYRGDAYVEGGGGAPDVVTATNLEGTTAYNITQVVGSAQPHSGDVLGFPALAFDESASQNLVALSATPALTAAADECTIFAVLRHDITAAGFDVALEIGPGASFNEGIMIGMESGVLHAQARVASDGLAKRATSAFTDTASIHVARATLDATGIHVGLDGTETSTLGTFAGVENVLNGCSMSKGINNTSFAGTTNFESVVMVNPTAQQIADVEAFLISKYGV